MQTKTTEESAARSDSSHEEQIPLFQKILRHDLPASLVVFLIAIPLSLGIALASNAPIMAGLIAAVVGGILTGALGGSSLQVSGPAAGLTLVVYGLVTQFGWPVTCAITLMAGILQIIFGVLRIARGALAISPAVVHGMLAGIGITIALAQIHIVLGGSPESSALKNLRDLPGQIADLHGGATFLGLLTIGILFSWRYLPAVVRRFPAPLAAVVIGTLASIPMQENIKRVDLPANLYQDHVLPKMPSGDWGAVAVAVFTVALIASIESLLSAVAVDKMHTGPRANLDRELIGQGAGNALSGALGGLPITGVIVRSSANVNAGGKTRASAIMHGVWVLIFVALLGTLIEKIPLAVLAGLLVHVGIQLVKPGDIRELTHHREVSVYWVTVLGVVALGLLYGVGLGVALAVILLLRRLTNLTVHTNEAGNRILLRIEGSLTFFAVPQLSRALSAIRPGTVVDVDLAVDFMDHAAFEALHSWRVGHEKSGGRVDIDEMHEAWYANAAAGHPRKDKSPVSTVSNALFGRRKRTDENGETIEPVADANDPLIDGAIEFQKNGAPRVRPLLSQLARDGQKPHDLFIACSDSRVLPHVFTMSGPGDLFKLRNIGNLVPPLEQADASVAAAIDFSLDALEVPGIVICGHSGCGAMMALLERSDLSEQPHLAKWLENGQRSLARYNSGDVPDASLPPYDQLSQVNVIQQIENLLTYPKVRTRYEAGELRIVGMFFDIEKAQVFLLDDKTKKFLPVSEEEAAEAAALKLPSGVAALSHIMYI